MWRSVFVKSVAAAITLFCGTVAFAPYVLANNQSSLNRPSPDWRDQIVYSLMIDRFEDGDPSNNDQGFNEYHPSNDAYFNGGDIKGIIRRVPYLKALGVTATWISPPTATQWWDPATQYSGYHGYWPVHFKKIDAHFGSLDDYIALSRTLHGNAMYLIQDVVVNQIGHYYNYAGGYDPANKRKNFKLSIGAIPPKPLMYPFNLVNLLSPEAAKADIYHWTPSITNYADPAQQFNHQLQLMNDLNTSNPLVRNALKDAYAFWIKTVGVDAFRVDAAKHVEADFLHDFVHGSGGVLESARATGREDFFTFGEIFNFSDPFEVNGEKQISQFMGDENRPQLGYVINFPLQGELRRVFARGMPTSLLGFRLKEQARQFTRSAHWPTFLNNHDLERFLETGSVEAYRQAYLVLMTIPGIPVIYQGDELGFTDIRRPIFSGATEESIAFDQSSEHFRFMQSIIALRKKHPALRRGTLTVLQDSSVDSGVFAFKREYEGEVIYIILNSSAMSNMLLNRLPITDAKFTGLEIVYALNSGEEAQVGMAVAQNHHGQLTRALRPYSALVLRATKAQFASIDSPSSQAGISLDNAPNLMKLKALNTVCGRASTKSSYIQMLINSNLDSARRLKVNQNGSWCAKLPAISLVSKMFTAEFFDPANNTASEKLMFDGQGSVDIQQSYTDPAGDDRGPEGKYRMLTDAPDHRAADIRSVDVRANDEELELSIKVAEIKNVWNYVNKFDHASFSIYIDSHDRSGVNALPRLSHNMPKDARWDVSHRLFGMGSAIHLAKGANTQDLGTSLAGQPFIQIDSERRRFTIRYSRTALGIKSWKSAKIYIASWDTDELGKYRNLGKEASAKQLGGGGTSDPHILDDIFISLAGKSHQ